MSTVNGSANGHEIQTPAVPLPVTTGPRISQKRLKLLEELAVPFDPVVIQWLILESTQIAGGWRGRVIPYGDKLAYLERLNRLLTPIGWSSSLTVSQPMSNPQERVRSMPGKVVVTCQVTIHGLGSHSSTGEEWATDTNAATSAEAQALKRACAHFGLGAYLMYFFRGTWVDLDDRKQVINPPALPAWATPGGWLSGARPSIERIRDNQGPSRIDVATIREIESMKDELGQQVYRRILKNYRVWGPHQIGTPEVAGKILQDMKSAQDLLLKASHALSLIGEPAFQDIITRHKMKSVADFGDLGSLRRIVADLEAKVNDAPTS